jgi:hypothetical protein
MATSISGNGGTDTFYIQQSGSNIQYKKNSGSWTTISSWPLEITNDTPSSGYLPILFTTNITFSTSTSQYFSCKSSKIQFGSQSTNADGSIPTITISGITGFLGLIRNGISGAGQTGYANILVFNLSIIFSSSTLANGGGMIGQGYYARGVTGCYIINCNSNGAISTLSGGIVGQYAASNNGNLTILGCYSLGAISDNGAGGIVGVYSCYQGGTLLIDRCYSTGTIAVNAGGIAGYYTATGNLGNTADVTIQNSFSLGNITGGDSGGIVGISAANAYGSLTITKCYSRGNISANAGGIVGGSAGNGTTGSVTVTNCYSTGSINSTGGGIFARNYTSTALAYNCYTSGSGSTGGIYYNSTNDNVQGSGNYSEANNSGSGWNDSNASAKLTGVSNNITWISLSSNTAYVLVNFGYSTYSVDNIIDSYSLKSSESFNIYLGSTSLPAIKSGPTYSLLKVDGSTSFSSFTINSSTGVITPASSTPVGTYTLFIYAVEGDSYAFITYTLSIFNVLINVSTITCCESTYNLENPSYNLLNELKMANAVLVDFRYNSKRQFTSYAEYIKMLQARR